jgi:hypothetical protein
MSLTTHCPAAFLVLYSSAFAADLACDTQSDRVVITDAGRPVCEYRFADKEIPRPYFCNVRAPCGAQVTRPHPPGPGDLDDHATFHPGIWLAFGDLNGADSWRLAAPIEHVEFIDAPHVADGAVTFTVHNHYRNASNDSTLCDEVAEWTLSASDGAYLVSLDTRFTSDQTLVFGDQEEMGLGVRLATPIAENQELGGLLTDSTGRTTAQNVWGQPADWCDYSGTIGDQQVGITMLAHPENSRESRWHARDYGPLVGNPIAQKAFTGQDAAPIVVQPGDEFRLRFRIVIHNGRPGAGYDPAAANTEFAGANR